MPDQHTAATEHALIAKIAEPLDHLPDDPLAIVSVDFPVALRGYDRFAVDAYVERTAQLVAELQATRSPEAAVRRALERVGEEISGILTRAHDTADEITTRSRAEAEERLEAARLESSQITAQAERRVKDLDAETERIWAERHSIVTDARDLARRLTELAESALERFPADGPIVDATVGEPSALLSASHLFDGAADAAYPPLGTAEDELTAVLPGEEQQTAVLGERVAFEPAEGELEAVELAEGEGATVEWAEGERAAYEPAEDEPAADGPAEGEHAAYGPAEGEPAAYEPAEDEHAAVERAGSEPTRDEPTENEPTVERSVVDQPTVEQPSLDEHAVVQPIGDEPTTPIEPREDRPLNPPWAAGGGAGAREP